MNRPSHLIVKWRAALLACLAGSMLLGCATGQHFSTDAVAGLQPGKTTMVDAVQVLQGMPQQVLPQSDGSTIALWAYKISLVTDAIYYRREAMLQFGPDGRLARVLDTTNVPLTDATRRKLLGAASIPTETAATDGSGAQTPASGAAMTTSPGTTAIPVSAP
ncbi:hypothetical protein [Bordetella bronchialis]|uniref:Lipoprotein SmpA/OmlA domain-containing protein n=1 Tax=Bordetella bronchialis TaxID=463025 RepID=A0A193FGP2_9BORD|nr:hypothetical protein [Bordetella bronchialis]ANN66805.1 hypothetical protein BAU06_11395 [Bordetella bronchialis]ANN71882.1 hypothetical protein BAU08_11595 [Bordetella bronchialis]